MCQSLLGPSRARLRGSKNIMTDSPLTAAQLEALGQRTLRSGRVLTTPTQVPQPADYALSQ